MFKTMQVIRFEVMRSLKKPSFWLAALLVPACLALYIIVCGFAGYTAGSTLEASSPVSSLKLAYVDEAEYVKKNIFVNEAEEEQEIQKLEDFDQALKDLKQGKYDILYYIPETFSTDADPSVEIYTKLDKNNITDDYKAPILALLLQTAETNTKHIDASILTDKISYNTTSYALDGHKIDKKELITKLVAPVAAVVLFYILMAVLGNRLSVSMTEEKENRISELLLVSIKPINLIVGKIVSLMILGLIQLIVLLIPVVIVYLLALRNNLIPEEYMISLDIQSIALHALLLIASYFLFTAINVLVGTLVSTAKEASSFAGVIVIVMIIPFMMLNVFTTGETSTLLYILSYFPLSAPLALMIRSIFDSLPQWELLLGIADISFFAILLAFLAARIFCRNAVNFSIGLNFSSFGKKRKSW